MQSLDAILHYLGWIPLWLWIGIAASVVGAWVKFFGWRGAIPALVAVLSLGLLARVRRGGWEAREKAGAENVKRVVKNAKDARDKLDADLRANPDRLRKDDGYRRD